MLCRKEAFRGSSIEKGRLITFTKTDKISRIFFGNITKTLLTLPVMFARMQIEQMKATITASLNTKIDIFFVRHNADYVLLRNRRWGIYTNLSVVGELFSRKHQNVGSSKLLCFAKASDIIKTRYEKSHITAPIIKKINEFRRKGALACLASYR